MLENEVILSIVVRQHWIVVNNYDRLYVSSETHWSNHNETIKGIVVPACQWEGRSKVDERYVAQYMDGCEEVVALLSRLHWIWAYWWAISMSEKWRAQALPWKSSLCTQGMKMSPEERRLIISTHSRQSVDGRLPSSFYQLRFHKTSIHVRFMRDVKFGSLLHSITRRSFP